MAVGVREIRERNDIRRFIDFPWEIYRKDKNWVPPLKSEMWSTVSKDDNPLFKCGPHALFLAEDGGQVVGRVMTAIDNELNAARGRGWGYFSLFETGNDPAVVEALLTRCEEWLRERGCRVCRGPVSPDNGDGYRGMLIQGFDTAPVFMDSYNPTYYPALVEGCGYKGGGDDRLAYYYEAPETFPEKAVRTLAYAKSRWKFRVDRADLKNLESEFVSLKTVVDASMPEWPDMVPPSIEELRLMAKKILPVADPDFIYLARSEAGEPIGFLLGLPDYNQALKHVSGSLFPFGWAKFLWYRRKIDGLRVFGAGGVLYKKYGPTKSRSSGSYAPHAGRAECIGEGRGRMDQKIPEVRDYVVSGMTLDGRFRVLAVRSTMLVEEGRRRHNCSKTATAVLGRVMTGAVLMAATLRENQSITVKVLGGGPCGGVISDSYRTLGGIGVRGYLGDPTADLPPTPEGKLDVGGLVGKEGFVYVTKDLGLKDFYTGSSQIQSGEIGIDLAYYYAVSEQLPSAVSLGVRLGGSPRGGRRAGGKARAAPTGWVTGAGGVLVQAMPGHDAGGDDTVARVEKNVGKMGSVSMLIQDGATPEDLAREAFRGISEVTLMDTIPASFACRCSRERAVKTLITLGKEDLGKLASERDETEVKCHFCNETYIFPKDEILEIARGITGP